MHSALKLCGHVVTSWLKSKDEILNRIFNPNKSEIFFKEDE
ncbi:hypothetical protein AO373_1232 [Moraxella catarrhalis]|nr:hypothetical protein AO379_1747 [Moraxella catarrhalis]OAV17995.1 hypothetical protein AO373_1232 [Moraxella catarrhalis]